MFQDEDKKVDLEIFRKVVLLKRNDKTLNSTQIYLLKTLEMEAISYRLSRLPSPVQLPMTVGPIKTQIIEEKFTFPQVSTVQEMTEKICEKVSYCHVNLLVSACLQLFWLDL